MEQIRKLITSLSVRQRWSVLAAALLVAAGLFAFAHYRQENGFRPLYTALAAEDAGAVVAKLKQANVEYRLADNGTSVLVPEARLSELRLQMAVDGLPKTGRIGFEIFDKTNFGVTEFAEHINYRRALEGELERSMAHLAEVEQARVHLTFPKDSVFLEARQPAKASVMLKLRAGARLSPQNVQAICQLTASAVDGLAPEAVSVLDTRGNLLNRPRTAGPNDELAASEAVLDYRRQIERDLAVKIRSTLDPLMGVERYQAGITVDCELTSGELSEENFDPARTVMLSSQKSEDSTGGASTSGQPGTASNLPRPSIIQAGRTGTSRKTENITYQSSRTVRKTRQPQGGIKRVSVALLLDQDVRWEGAGPNARRVLVPPAPEKLKSIRDLVAGVVNFDQNRGDQIVVETLPFDATLRAAPPEAPAPPAALPKGRYEWRKWPPDREVLIAAGAAAVALLLFFAAGWLMSRARKRRRAATTVERHAALPGPANTEASLEARMEQKLADSAAERQRLEAEALASIKGPPVSTKKTDVLVKHLRESIIKDAPGMAQVLRGWTKK